MKNWPGKDPILYGRVEAIDLKIPAMFYQGEWFKISKVVALRIDRIAEPNHRDYVPEKILE